ncbi:ABC transporter permease [Sporosarcina sp. OR05]|uniref:ABC transporter permease n=1 Tax=Sporosarcina sp. OR05 TaxID=2969819 RepID=UPI003529ED26
MKSIFAICLLELKRTFKKKSAYVLMFAMPLLFAYLFGSLFGASSTVNLRIAVVDEDQTIVSQQIKKRLMLDDMISYELLSAEQAEQQLTEREIEGVLTLTNGAATKVMSGEPIVEFHYLPGTAIAPIILQQVQQAVLAVEIEVVAAQTGSSYLEEDWVALYERMTTNVEQIPVWTEQATRVPSTGMTSVSYSSAGFAIMFVMMMMLTMTGILIEAKQMGIWSRLFTSPVTRFQVLAGYFLSFFFVGWLQFGVLIVLSSVLFGVTWGNPFGLAVLVTGLIVCIVGLGIAIASLVQTAEQQNAIGTLIVISTCMLGGVYWPLSVVPEVMQKIAYFVPQSWAMKGFTALIAEGGALQDIAMPLLVLLGFAAIFFTIGLRNIKYV